MAIIAVSHAAYSGGERLAMEVAERLEYHCTSGEVLLDAARKYKISYEELRAGMETSPSFWDWLIGARTAYLAFVQAVLCEQARDGDFIYHGHIGHLLLPNIAHVIRVRVVAGMEFRLEMLMRQQHLRRNDALAYIDHMDRRQRQWVRYLFDVEWEKPHLYDLVLNMDRMTSATACETVVQLVAHDEFQPTPDSMRALQDFALASQVRAALAQNPDTKDASLDVVAETGLVTIIGKILWPTPTETVERVAHQVEGVKDVQSIVESVIPLSYYQVR